MAMAYINNFEDRCSPRAQIHYIVCFEFQSFSILWNETKRTATDTDINSHAHIHDSHVRGRFYCTILHKYYGIDCRLNVTCVRFAIWYDDAIYMYLLSECVCICVALCNRIKFAAFTKRISRWCVQYELADHAQARTYIDIYCTIVTAQFWGKMVGLQTENVNCFNYRFDVFRSIAFGLCVLFTMFHYCIYICWYGCFYDSLQYSWMVRGTVALRLYISITFLYSTQVVYQCIGRTYIYVCKSVCYCKTKLLCASTLAGPDIGRTDGLTIHRLVLSFLTFLLLSLLLFSSFICALIYICVCACDIVWSYIVLER